LKGVFGFFPAILPFSTLKPLFFSRFVMAHFEKAFFSRFTSSVSPPKTPPKLAAFFHPVKHLWLGFAKGHTLLVLSLRSVPFSELFAPRCVTPQKTTRRFFFLTISPFFPPNPLLSFSSSTCFHFFFWLRNPLDEEDYFF